MMRQRPERTRTETFKSQGFSLLTPKMFPRLRHSQTGAQTGLVLLSTQQLVRLSLHRGGFWEMLSDRDKHHVHSSTYRLFIMRLNHGSQTHSGDSLRVSPLPARWSAGQSGAAARMMMLVPSLSLSSQLLLQIGPEK